MQENQVQVQNKEQTQIAKAQEHINYLNSLKKRTDIVSNENMQILEAKYAQSNKIGEIDLLQLDNSVKVAMLRIHVITGWTIPVNEMMQLFIDEFRNLLLQEYEDVKFEEIIFAFRKYKHLVEDWGKEMNLKLIGKVLDAYMEDRYDAGLLEERIKMNENVHQLDFQPKKYTDEENLQVSSDYWLNSKSPKVEFINPNCYEILLKQGKINLTEEDKERIRKRADILMEGYFTNITELRKKREDVSYKSILCKKIAVSEYFNTIK